MWQKIGHRSSLYSNNSFLSHKNFFLFWISILVKYLVSLSSKYLIYLPYNLAYFANCLLRFCCCWHWFLSNSANYLRIISGFLTWRWKLYSSFEGWMAAHTRKKVFQIIESNEQLEERFSKLIRIIFFQGLTENITLLHFLSIKIHITYIGYLT